MASSDLEVASVITEREHLLIRAASGYGATLVTLPDKLGALSAVARTLSAAKLPHALIGGLAVGIRSGVPRATLDVDVAVSSSANRAEVVQLLTRAEFELTGEFVHSVNFRHTSGEPLQLAFDPAFDPMIQRAESVVLEGFSIPVVTTADLIEMKRRAAADPRRRRSKALRDQADIALLEGDVPDPNEGW